MRFSLNTILIALVSSSVIMTDVMAVPLTKISHFGKPPRKLARRQDAPSQNSTAIANELKRLISSATGIALLANNIELTVEDIVTDLGFVDSGTDGQDDGDSSGAGDSGSTDSNGSGDAGNDAGASGGSDGTSGSTNNQRRGLEEFCRSHHIDEEDCNAILNHFGAA